MSNSRTPMRRDDILSVFLFPSVRPGLDVGEQVSMDEGFLVNLLNTGVLCNLDHAGIAAADEQDE